MLEDLSERQLRKAKRDSQRTLKRLATLDVAKAVREGRTQTLVEEGERAVAQSQAATKELHKREFLRLAEDVKFQGLARELSRREYLDPVPFQRLSVRVGLALDPRRLSREERKEFLRLSRRDDRVRFEALAEKAAGAPEFFEDRRQEQAAKAKLAELSREGREAASLDVRVPGRVFRWLDDGAPKAPHSLFDIAVLAALAHALENSRLPGRGAAFEGDVLVLTEDFELSGCEWPNDPMRCRAALSRLSANGLLRVSKDAGMLRVTLPKH